MEDNNDSDHIKKSSIRIYRDMLSAKFEAQQKELNAQSAQIQKRFEERIKAHEPAIRAALLQDASVSASFSPHLAHWNGQVLLRLQCERIGFDGYPKGHQFDDGCQDRMTRLPASLQQEMQTVHDLGKEIRTKKDALYQRERYAGFERDQVVLNLLQTRPDGVELLKQIEMLANDIAGDINKKG